MYSPYAVNWPMAAKTTCRPSLIVLTLLGGSLRHLKARREAEAVRPHAEHVFGMNVCLEEFSERSAAVACAVSLFARGASFSQV
jgi:hypothetical protein